MKLCYSPEAEDGGQNAAIFSLFIWGPQAMNEMKPLTLRSIFLPIKSTWISLID